MKLEISKDWCMKMAELEGDVEVGAGSPMHPLRQAEPDWPPQSSASKLPEGTLKYGSTGQLWEVRGGVWVRVRDKG